MVHFNSIIIICVDTFLSLSSNKSRICIEKKTNTPTKLHQQSPLLRHLKYFYMRKSFQFMKNKTKVCNFKESFTEVKFVAHSKNITK